MQGLLDPPEALRFREREDAAVLPAEPPRAPRPAWRIPPPGFGLRSTLRAPAVLGGAPAPGDTVEILVPKLPDAAERQVVLLFSRGARWTVIAPRREGEVHRLDAVARPVEGGLALEVVVPRGGGRFAVALPRLDQPMGPRWRDLQGAIARGEVPVSSVDLAQLDSSIG